MKFCPECDYKLPQPNPKFCSECGTALSSSKDSPVPETAKKAVPKAISRKRLLIAGALVLLLAAIFLSLIVDAGSRSIAKDEQARQQAQMQDAVQKHQEDLQRQQVLADAKRKAELENTMKQFVMTMNYDAVQMNATFYEYGPEPITDANLAKKAAAARKFALQVNEYCSHIDGMEEFIRQNLADIKRLSSTEVNETSLFERLDASKAFFKEAENQAALELETFAKSNSLRMGNRMLIIDDAVRLLRGEDESP